MNTATAQTPYERLGGETAVRALTQRFYALMDSRGDTVELRALHPANLSSSEQKLFEYLSGWLGGPPLFENRHGHPMLRARHLPFAITSRERDQWLSCMRQALEDTVTDLPLRDKLYEAMAGLANHMRNQPDS